MNSKADTKTMNQEKKHELKPKLRFPEFRDAEEWEEKKLGSMVQIFSGNAPSSHKLSSAIGCPYVKVEDMNNCSKYQSMSREYIEKTTKNLPAGSVIFPKRGAAIMGNKVRIAAVPFYIDSNMMALFPHKKFDLSSEFLYYLIFTQQLSKIADTSTIPQINNKHILAYTVSIPTLSEQTKISDCLTSIDDRITAETQKLGTLKVHKKGLMQQLFPAEGETVPDRRFPEFQDTEEWEEKSIQDLIDKKIITSHLDGNHGALYPQAEEFSKEGIPYISANDFITGYIDFSRCKYLPEQRALQFKKGVAKDGDILFAHNATVGPVAKLSTNLQFVILSTTATYFRCNDKYLINDFLKFSLCSPSFIKQYTRVMSQSTRNQVPITTQRKFNLLIPTWSEQKKIADCLTSIDELITAQTQKIHTLKTHKKGLMQQLFPAVEDAIE